MWFSRTRIPNDCIAVIDAAGVLGIREIDLFRLAPPPLVRLRHSSAGS